MALSPLKARHKYLSRYTIISVSRATDAAHFAVPFFGEAPGPGETQPRASAGQGAARTDWFKCRHRKRVAINDRITGSAPISIVAISASNKTQNGAIVAASE